ncbi:MAG: Na(+)/H(+) antiporter subunit D [Balneolaceae bacterium]
MIVELFTVPAIILIFGAFLLPLIPERFRSSVFILFPLAVLGIVWTLPEGSLLQAPFASYQLHLLTVDMLSRVFGTIFVLITIIGGVYAFHIKDLGQQVTALAYAGGALGVTFAGDFITLFMFWEIMAIASTYLIWARRTKDSDKSGMRYLLVHIVGGGFLLSGILLHISQGGSALIGNLEEVYSLANIFMLLGVSVNSAIPPLHAWLADAYPRATITGAVFMSAFTTKSAVYILIRLFPGWDILVYVGVAMALYGVVYAVLVNDIREILAYHIISQVGYMVAGVGIGTEMAINGTTAHAFSHILYKSLLFMGAGAVMQATGKSKLTELGGFARKMPVVVGLYMIGAFSISGFPLFNGFISKSMVVSAAGAAHFETVMLLLTLASVGTFLHTGLKLPYFTWFGEKKSEFTVSPIPLNMKIAMGIGAFLCTLFGVYPALLYNYLPYTVDYQPYTVYHLVEMMQILVFTFIGFWISRVKLAGTATIAIDTDWLYRKPAPFFQQVLVKFPARIFDSAEKNMAWIIERIANVSRNPLNYVLPSSPKQPVYTDGFTSPMHWALALILFSFLLLSLYILF